MIRNHDLFVADNLTARLRGSGIPGLRAVDVTVDDRTATLDGSLSCFYEKQVCLSVCLGAVEIDHIVDQIQVSDDNHSEAPGTTAGF